MTFYHSIIHSQKAIRCSVLSLMVLMCVFVAKAQTYRMELGINVGYSSYLGDASSSFLQNPQPAYGLLARYNFNRRFVLKADLGLAGIAGSTIGEGNLYVKGEEFRFDRKLADAALELEFNFYEFGAPDYLPGASRISPYVLAGIGACAFKTDHQEIACCIPVGLGIKYKCGERFNIGFEASCRFSLSDRLDYAENHRFQLDDPWVAQSYWNKNKDAYPMLKLYISYDLFYIGSSCYKQ